MSTIEYNNLVSAGGDGIKRKIEKPRLRRTPVPSSRKLTARPQVKNDNIKLKLEDALRHTPSPKTQQFTRKRAQTMAEITPSKRKIRAESTNRQSSTLMEGVSSTANKSAPRKEDASRRVYQQLLLNAWRRRRVQVATLTDSSRRLQSQMDQLQIQIDVLQKLREAESQRRLESASEAERLRQEKEELRHTVEKLLQDGKSMEKDIAGLQQKIDEINVSCINLKNELLAARCELSTCEAKLQKKCRNNESLEAERRDLLDKIEEYRNTSTEQFETICRLENDLESVERNLDTVNLNNSRLEESKTDLEIKLENERDTKDDLERQFIKSRLREERLEKKVYELKKTVSSLSEAKKQMLLDNFALKRTLKELEDTLKEERSNTWWKSAAKVMMSTLHNAAYAMLPAYPKKFDGYASMEVAGEENVL